MCKLIESFTKKKMVTGYKVAIKYKDKYYSPATGAKYKLGKVRTVNKIRNTSLFNPWLAEKAYLISNTYIKEARHYDALMKGKTSIFVKKHDVIDLLKYSETDFTLVLLQVTLKDNLWKGYMNGELEIIAGEYIVSMEELQ